MPPTSYTIQAYKRNDEWHLDSSNPDHFNPDHHKKMKALIKKINGQWWKVTIDDKEDWELEFLDYWESCESGKDRRSPEQVAADKAEAVKKALPPSMQGNVIVPTVFKIYKSIKEARQSEYINKDIHFIYLRYSGKYSMGLDTAKLSAANQLADYQKVSGQAFPIGFWSVSASSLANSTITPLFKTVLGRLSSMGSIIHVFALGLEGFVRTRSAFQEVYDAIKMSSPQGTNPADLATITYALQDKEADLYGNQAEFLQISDTSAQRRCIRFYLHEILTATNNSKVDWLRGQLKLRTEGRTSLEGHVDAKEFYKARVAASLMVKRHAAYGNMKGNQLQGEQE